ncbi:MAG TPA: 6-phosphogluconolactonase [Solirubrobacteraceae bacterium]|nr:6-phosphogluconolactonase [Solirubrobacteraceae bacterium]
MHEPLVTRVADAEEAARRAAEVLAAALDGARTVHGVAHGALAGGSTPRRAYELLGALLGDWADVHLWFGDERCVGPDDADSNARMVREALDAPGATVHRIRGELGAEAAAAAYGQELGETTLDVALLGLGEDGHTASLFPRRAELDAGGVAVPVHHAPKPPPDRVSLTLGKLNAARRIVLLVSGAGKAQALARVLAAPDRATPASLLDRAKLEIVADAAALGDA